MKYIIILGDGMADEPVESLGGKTPLEAAHTPLIDALAAVSQIGLVQTIPKGMQPGSDTANLSVLGYDPLIYYSGRAPLEALSIGADMSDKDVAMRTNIVTISEDEPDFAKKIMLDFSADELEQTDASALMDTIKKELNTNLYQFYTGTGYRNLLVLKSGKLSQVTAPHDIVGKQIGEYLPSDRSLLEMMKRSYELLNHHPVNEERRKHGKKPANCCWFWGQGTLPKLLPFYERTGKKGIMISGVDLLKGIAVGIQMQLAKVPGATGGLDTNYEGKARAAVHALLNEGYDLAYIHIEAPDAMGHKGSVREKVQAIEYIDQKIVKYIKDCLDKEKTEYRILILPDHATPVNKKNHTAKAVPYLLYDSTKETEHTWLYSEAQAKNSGTYIAKGHTLIDRLLEI